jgi:DNA-binding beta-propeller fold protein YncE
MKLTDQYDGSNDPFEGDRTLLWTSLPAGAKVSHARLTLTPVGLAGGILFQEQLRFTANQGDWGATKAKGTVGAKAYVEVDFHKPRTLVSVVQSGLVGASLQIDMGGVFVEINSKGAIKTPTDATAFSLAADGGLPSLRVSKFRLIAANAGPADVSSVVINTVPANINVRLGKMGAFWPRPGDLTGADTSPDFADVLQVFLNNAPVANGFYAVPLAIHSDSLARLDAGLEVEYVQQTSVMPDGVKEVVLPFDFSSVPNARPGTLSVSLPPNAHVVPGVTTARVLGAFDDTRVVYGATGEVFPTGAITITPDDSQAQMFALDAPVAASAVDVFIGPQPPGITLAVDLRADLDGKPDSTSLLGAPVQVTVPSKPDRKPSWVNAPLGAEVHLQAKKYWLVLQNLQGQADWSVQPASSGKPIMQHTQDGGFSWRETPAPAPASPPSAFFRLRQAPAAFRMPVDLQIGSGSQAQRISLERFQPMGRVDFMLNVPEVANGFNAFLAGAPAACSDTECLANGNFEQWSIIGNDPGKLARIAAVPDGSSVGAVAVTTNGKTAYVAYLNGQAMLASLDVACNRVAAPPLDLGHADLPQILLLYPDGSKALVMGGGTLAWVDLANSVVLKSATTVPNDIVAMVFNADGSRLYAGVANLPARANSLFRIDTAALEQALTAGTLSTLFSGGTPAPGEVVALQCDQNRLYVLARNATSGAGTLLFVDPESLQSDGDPVATGPGPSALALAPDGSHAVVANFNRTLAVIGIAHKTVTSIKLDGDSGLLFGIVVSPDSRRVYVGANPDRGNGQVIIVDLVRRSVVQSVDASPALTSLAITPQGDQLYAGAASVIEAATSGTPLSYLPIGARLPADWFLTSGEISLLCLPQVSDAHVVALLGPADRTAPTQPSALSQVTPISGGCTYDFSFAGTTNDPRAVAEVIWRGQGCGGIKTDSVAIPAVTETTSTFVLGHAAGVNQPATNSFAAAGNPPNLAPARARLTAPLGANSAEVRFTVPDGSAYIALPSLKGSAEGLVNTGLQPQQPSQTGLPDQWTVSPATARGFLTTHSGGEVVLRNTGPDTADLVQTATVTAGQPFNFEFIGRALTLNASNNPKLSLRWLKSDGSEAATAVSQDIAPEAFDTRPMSGQVPDGATQVEVHLGLPSGTALSVDRVSLQMPKATQVPVSFVAQSPGQLRVSAAQVGYDIAKPAPPPVPAAGLCPPTPPGQKPGAQPAGSCHCSCCQAETQITNAASAMTPAGRPMMVGRCADCGNQVVSGGGKLTAGALQPLTLRMVPTHFTRPVSAETLTLKPAPAPLLTEVVGIGKARAQQLERAGIKSVREFAAADPEYVAKVVVGVSVKNAALLVEHAKKLLATHA